ncbi:MAG: hypothetical protein RIR51_446 [Bacteroidota bacterium]|jgi:cell division protein ZapA (FtsZ GTPase activity inhibitor)
MNQKLACNLNLGIQKLTLKVDSKEEENIRQAAKLVNEMVQFYEKKLNSSDPNKIMAMVALDLGICSFKFENQIKNQREEVEKGNKDLLKIVDSYLN